VEKGREGAETLSKWETRLPQLLLPYRPSARCRPGGGQMGSFNLRGWVHRATPSGWSWPGQKKRPGPYLAKRKKKNQKKNLSRIGIKSVRSRLGNSPPSRNATASVSSIHSNIKKKGKRTSASGETWTITEPEKLTVRKKPSGGAPKKGRDRKPPQYHRFRGTRGSGYCFKETLRDGSVQPKDK